MAMLQWKVIIFPFILQILYNGPARSILESGNFLQSCFEKWGIPERNLCVAFFEG